MKKSRNTKTKMKALSAEALANAEQAKAAAEKLEEDIIKAAQGQSQGQGQTEETKTLIEVNRVPDSAVTAEPPVRYNPDARGTGAGPAGPGSQPSGGKLPGTSFGGGAQRSGPPVHNSALNGKPAHLRNQAPGQGQHQQGGPQAPDMAPASEPNGFINETGTSASLMRLPENTDENMDEKISGLWKSRVLGAYRANPKASQHILPAMPNNRGALEVTEKAKLAAQHEAMISLVDKMFDRFQNLAFEFNTVARGSDLELTWIRPVISKENISSWHQSAQIVSVFTGRVSARHWTMVVRGTQDCVVVYVIPAERMLTFANQPANFQPVIELIPVADGLTVRWWVQDKVVSHDDLVNIYRALLDNMIRIAQDDASADQFIDLAAYGVFLQGGEGPAPGQFVQTSSAQMAHPAGFAAPAPQASAAPLSQTPAALPQGDDDGWKSADEDWKPVVRSLRANNATPAGSGQSSSPNNSNIPSTPGFNDDEPGRYSMPGSMPGPGSGQGVGPGSGAFGGGQFGNQQFNGSQFDDEAPLPSLPAHLFEGLPPRPRAQPQAQASNQAPGHAQAPAQAPTNEFKPLTPSLQANAPANAQPTAPANPPASPWGAPTGTGSGVSYSSVGSRTLPPLPNAQPQPSPASGRDSSDGWKKADVKGGGGAMPPLPVPNYNPSTGNSFISEPAPLANALITPESFTSGSIRVDALAKEIAHSPMALPQAVPGFEPYKVDESASSAGQSSSEGNAFISNDVVGMDSSDRDVAALFDGEDVNSASRSQHGMRPAASSSSSSVPEKPYDLNVIGNVGFGRSHTDELPWPPGAKDRSQLEAEEARVNDLREKGAFDALDKAKEAPAAVPPQSSSSSGQRPALDPRSAIAEGFRQAKEAATNSSTSNASLSSSVNSTGPDPWLQAPPRQPEHPPQAVAAEAEAVNPFESANPFETPVFESLDEFQTADRGVDNRPEQKLEHRPEQMPDFFTAPSEAQVQDSEHAAGNSVHGYTEQFQQEHFQPAQQEVSPPSTDIAAQFGGFAKKSSPLDFIDFGPSNVPEPAQTEAPVAPEALTEVLPEMPEMPEIQEAAPEIVAEPDLIVEPELIAEPIQDAASQAPPEVEMLSPEKAPDQFPEQSSDQSSDQSLEQQTEQSIMASAPMPAAAASPAPEDTSLIGGLRRSLNGDIDRLLATLDEELELISDKGSEAFARRDLKGAEHLIKLAETLSEYKDGLRKLKADHGNELS